MAILEVMHLRKSFERTEVLSDISFSLEKGQALSIIGSSGSGKTTLLNVMAGLLKPYQGSVLIQNKKIKKHKNIYRGVLSVLPQQC